MVAWFAFGLSLVALLWNVITTFLRWPRIGVVMRQARLMHVVINDTVGGTGATEAEASTEHKFHVVVVNRGAEATTIANVGIRSEDGSRALDVESRRDQGIEISGPELPARVEAHGALHWVIDHQLVSEFPKGTNLIGFAYRYRTFRKRPTSRRSPWKIYETKIAYTTN